MVCHPDREKPARVAIKDLQRYEGLKRVPVEEVRAGDIAIVAGVEEISIGDTVCDMEHLDPLPAIELDEPTISMVFHVSNSPFAGREGRFVTSRQILSRLERAAMRDVALSVSQSSGGEAYEVKGRGVMHLGVLVENMRREGYEFSVGKPHVILKEVDGERCEPYERATVEVPSDNAGKVIEYLGKRRGELKDPVVGDEPAPSPTVLHDELGRRGRNEGEAQDRLTRHSIDDAALHEGQRLHLHFQIGVAGSRLDPDSGARIVVVATDQFVVTRCEAVDSKSPGAVAHGRGQAHRVNPLDDARQLTGVDPHSGDVASGRVDTDARDAGAGSKLEVDHRRFAVVAHGNLL